MGSKGDDTTEGERDTAASRLKLLSKHFREHARTAPAERTGRRAHAGAPLNLKVADHITASVAEVADHGREVNPDAGPLPPRVEAVYDWYLANTKTAPAAEQQRRDTIVYRQRLEHAIAMGDTKVIRPHRCPACKTFGLMWPEGADRAWCTNTRCTTKGGLCSSWTLAKLAYEHVAAQYKAEKNGRVRAT
jgi:hypothetical protein